MTEPTLQPQSGSGFKLLHRHSKDCFLARMDDPPPVVFVMHDGVDFRRDRLGRKGGSQLWHRFRCNDPNCGAVAIVRWDVLARFVSSGLTDA